MENVERTLLNIPRDVELSAPINRTGWLGRVSAWGLEKLLYWIGIGLTLSRWTWVYWLVVANIPLASIEAGIPGMRDFIVKSYLISFAVLMAAYFVELLLWRPLPARGWSCLSQGELCELFFGGYGKNVSFPWYQPLAPTLGPSAMIFGALLLGATYMGSHGSTVNHEHLIPGLQMVGIGLACLYFDLRPPKFGMKVPTDREATAAAQVREHQRMAPRAPGRDSESKENLDYAVPVQAQRATLTFADIFGMQRVKDKLQEAAQAIILERPNASAEAPRNGILLHGSPGNGKTVFGEALAGELGIPFIQVTYGDVSSKWVGETPKVLSKTFEYAKRNAPCVLFVDEIDSFITSRDTASNNAEDQKITNTLLTEIVNLRKHRVILIGATNYLDRLDTAATREGRFDFKVEVTPPDEPARIGLLTHAIGKHAAGIPVDASALRSVATRWNGFSVSRLMAVAKAMPGVLRSQATPKVGFAEWMAALREVQGRAGRVPGNTKSMHELVLEPDTRQALEMIASRLKDAHRVESLGGTLPSGVLFYGPSGTGKTATARALAKDVGWAFLSVAGPDLLQGGDTLAKIFAEARDLRPTLLFVDEADDILRNRQYSSHPHMVNKLLTLMDGVDERVKDVVVVAATNHPDQIDPALLRAGRFTEKVGFSAPLQSEVPRFVAKWLKAKGVGLSDGIDVFDLSDVLSGQTIANIEGALQYALNNAISKHTVGSVITLATADINAALRVVLGNSIED